MTVLHINRAGAASTVQDSGRIGTLQLGLPPSGAMDHPALVSGQHLLGHTQDEAAIEMAYANTEVTPGSSCLIAVTGAPVSLWVDGASACDTEVLKIGAGQRVSIKARSHGVYSYLHVSGGIATPAVFDSRSTSVREGIGGLAGTYLRDGDQLPIGSVNSDVITSNASLPLPESAPTLMLRFVPGFQYELLTEQAMSSLLESEFKVTSRANRMGVALSGDPVNTGVTSLLSEATCYGAIQLPGDGNPIVLLNDRQTVGGYPKPGAVIRSDCRRLAQARPGQRVRFAPCTPEEAGRIAWLEQHYLETRLR